MPCDCHGKDNVEIQRHVLVLLLAINATMFCLEVVAGILANSTALLADSLDMLADAAIYGIALYTIGKPNSAKRRAAFTSGIFQGVPIIGCQRGHSALPVRKRTRVLGRLQGAKVAKSFFEPVRIEVLKNEPTGDFANGRM
jgi:hypothetical protein